MPVASSSRGAQTVSQPPVSPARKTASMTFWLRTDSSSVNTRAEASPPGRPHEGLDLERILPRIGEAEDGGLRMRPIVQRHDMVAVEPGIEGGGDLDEAPVAVEHHRLPERHLRRDVEGEVEAVEDGADRGVDVGAEDGIALDARLHPKRLAPRGEARRHGGVDADVGQRAAAELRDVAHVGGIDVEIGERALHVAQPADRARRDQVAHLLPLRMVDDHEAFRDQHLVAVARGDHRRDVAGVERERLLHQHVLAGIGGADRPFGMLRGRQRDVDAVDLRRGQQRVAGAEGERRADAAGERRCPVGVAAGDGMDRAVAGFLDRRDQVLARDLRRRQDAPPEHRLLPRFLAALMAVQFANACAAPHLPAGILSP